MFLKPSSKSKPHRPAKAAPRGPSKLHAAQGAGLSPGLALTGLCLLAVMGAVVVLATGGRGQAVVKGAQDAVGSDFANLGFRVATVHLQGASKGAQDEIFNAAGMRLGGAILDVDLSAVRARVEGVGWVKSARVIRLLPDTLVIAVQERPIMAVWQHAGRTRVIASNGAPVSQVDPGRFTSLPLVVGEGANVAAQDILPLIAARPRLAARLGSLVRVDQRRWDLHLKDGAVILLPADDPVVALGQLDHFDVAAKVLDLGLARIDLRDRHMTVIRPRGISLPAAPKT